MKGLFITFLLGLFFLFGIPVANIVEKRREETVHFLISIAFGSLFALVVFDFLPEIISSSRGLGILYSILFILLGLFLLKILDIFTPDHHGNEKSREGEIVHIGIISTVAIVLHNIVEGMSVYSLSSSSLKDGIILALGVGLHNIPMGIFIYSTLKNEKMYKKIPILFFVFISTFLGGLIMNIFSSYISEGVVHYLTCVALGMVLYIVVFELLHEVLETKKKWKTALFVLIGFVFVLITILFA